MLAEEATEKSQPSTGQVHQGKSDTGGTGGAGKQAAGETQGSQACVGEGPARGDEGKPRRGEREREGTREHCQAGGGGRLERTRRRTREGLRTPTSRTETEGAQEGARQDQTDTADSQAGTDRGSVLTVSQACTDHWDSTGDPGGIRSSKCSVTPSGGVR